MRVGHGAVAVAQPPAYPRSRSAQAPAPRLASTSSGRAATASGGGSALGVLGAATSALAAAFRTMPSRSLSTRRRPSVLQPAGSDGATPGQQGPSPRRMVRASLEAQRAAMPAALAFDDVAIGFSSEVAGPCLLFRVQPGTGGVAARLAARMAAASGAAGGDVWLPHERLGATYGRDGWGALAAFLLTPRWQAFRATPQFAVFAREHRGRLPRLETIREDSAEARLMAEPGEFGGPELWGGRGKRARGASSSCEESDESDEDAHGGREVGLAS